MQGTCDDVYTDSVVRDDKFSIDGGRWPLRLLLDKSLAKKKGSIRTLNTKLNLKVERGLKHPQIDQTNKGIECIWYFSTQKIIV